MRKILADWITNNTNQRTKHLTLWLFLSLLFIWRRQYHTFLSSMVPFFAEKLIGNDDEVNIRGVTWAAHLETLKEYQQKYCQGILLSKGELNPGFGK